MAGRGDDVTTYDDWDINFGNSTLHEGAGSRVLAAAFISLCMTL